MTVPAVQPYPVRTEIATWPAAPPRSAAGTGIRAVEPTAGLAAEAPPTFRDAPAPAELTVPSSHGPALDAPARPWHHLTGPTA